MDPTNSNTSPTKKPPPSPTNFHLDTNTQLAPLLLSEIVAEQRWLQTDGSKTNEDGYIYESPTAYNNISTPFESADAPIKHCADYYLPYHEIETPQYNSHFTLEDHLIVSDDDESARYSENTTITACTPGTEASFPELSPIPEDWSVYISRDERIRLGIPVFQQASSPLTTSNDRRVVVAEHMENA
jgi:hypothetical protein